MAGRKKFRVRVRGKVRNQLLRRGGAAAGVALGLLFASWFFGAAVKASRGFLGGRFLSFRPAAFEVDCPAPAAAASARELMSKVLNAPLSARRCAELAKELRRRHPGLSSAAVDRNFFTGRVRLTASAEEVVAPVLLNGATAYLGVTGRLMTEKLSGDAPPPFLVEIKGPAGEAAGLAVFLSGVKPLMGLFPSKPEVLECAGRDWDCQLRLEDGSRVLWGGFEFTRLKILRLSEVMKDALPKTGGPVRVDLRYFREGKIFVSAVKSAAAPSK